MLADGLQILQEEVVLGAVEDARNAAGDLAGGGLVEHRHGGVERGAHAHRQGDADEVCGKGAAKAFAEGLRGEGVGDRYQDGCGSFPVLDKVRAARHEGLRLAAALGALDLGEAPIECGDGIYHVKLPSVAAIWGPVVRARHAAGRFSKGGEGVAAQALPSGGRGCSAAAPSDGPGGLAEGAFAAPRKAFRPRTPCSCRQYTPRSTCGTSARTWDHQVRTQAVGIPLALTRAIRPGPLLPPGRFSLWGKAAAKRGCG